MLKKTSLAEQAYDILLDRIINGKSHAGMRLTEESISAELGISRTPVRNALQLLEKDGLLESLAKGYRVGMPDRESMSELYECRARLECVALEMSIKAIPKEKIRELLNMLKSAKDTSALQKKSLKADEEMHSLIAEYSSNRYLCEILGKLDRQTAPYRKYRNSGNCISVLELASERTAILEAILERDLEKAKKLLSRHIMKGIENIPFADG